MRPLLLFICVGGLLLVPAGVSAAPGSDLEVDIRDRCEPFSFNQVLGEGSCVGDGNVAFGELMAEVEERHEHGAWRFKPERARVREGRDVLLENQGGEVHTFTLVERFGGGFVPELNDPAEDLAPECNAPPGPANVFLAAGELAELPVGLDPGVNRFQCCIHPWMRTSLTPR